ncbi:hypothetical protein OQY15_09685 [Pedobacter sp. MC2016-15]|uniref:hypothetical protein n=1 Tax=Pedobacter sp. MC2016-15 TaxID=2994473 RepID=UPI00224546D0|nr:hypothetical protein [Pedobacter sp. MC2016-15]MCX2479360.1 hypothetical protein [Pedobacter sp. MC2016-15]
METSIQISLTDDFKDLCCIYQIRPDVFLQTVIDQISYPKYYSNPLGHNRWATFCFLHFIQEEEPKYQVNQLIADKYLDLIDSSMSYNVHAQTTDIEIVYNKISKIMQQWLKEVLAQRSSYITDQWQSFE